MIVDYSLNEIEYCTICKLPLSISEDVVCVHCEERIARHMEAHKRWTVVNSGVELHKVGHATESVK